MATGLARELERIARQAGFAIDTPYCDLNTMITGIREVETLSPEATLSEAQRLALMENLRRVLTKTAAAPRPQTSLIAQCQLARWSHLRTVAPEAAEAYAGVLRWAGIEVPRCLLP